MGVANGLNTSTESLVVRTSLGVPASTNYAGDPNGNVAGVLGDFVTNSASANVLYMCTTAGNAASAVWTLQGGGGGSSPITAGSGTDSAIGGDGTAIASGANSFAYGSTGSGQPTTASGTASFAFGPGSQAVANYALAIGNDAEADGVGSIALGQSTFASGDNSIALLGGSTAAGNTNSIAILGNTGTAGSIAIGLGAANTAFARSCIISTSSTVIPVDTAVEQFCLGFSGGYRVFGGSLNVNTVGSGLKVAEGSNAKQGVATLVAGTVVVSNTSVTANSRIMLTGQNASVTGALNVSARTAGTSFTILSSQVADTGVVAYQIFEPAA